MGTVQFRKSMAASILPAMDGSLPECTIGQCLRVLLEPRERRCGSTVICTPCLNTDRRQLSGSGVDAVVVDRIIHDTIRIETGSHNMPEKIGTVQHGRIRWKPVDPTQAATGPQRQ
jgi:hypothetical protein